jgi:hypothetical protein
LNIQLTFRGYQSMRIQIHYDNPSNVVGAKDNSGVTLYYQTTLRSFST